MKFSLSVVIDESSTDGACKSLLEMSKNCGIVFPIMSEKSRGVPQLLQLHENFVLSPNLNLKLELVEVLFRQFPLLSTNEKADLPPIVIIVDIL